MPLASFDLFKLPILGPDDNDRIVYGHKSIVPPTRKECAYPSPFLPGAVRKSISCRNQLTSAADEIVKNALQRVLEDQEAASLEKTCFTSHGNEDFRPTKAAFNHNTSLLPSPMG